MHLTTSERSSLRLAARKLRSLSLAAPVDALLGSEDEVLAQLAVSRVTLKQAARLLEQEGLVRVRRGVNGGYYSSRPTEETLTAVASAYLHSIDVAAEDVISLNTVLWLEMVRRASAAGSSELASVLTALIGDIAGLADSATFHEVDIIEQASRRAIFNVADCGYLALIMRINQAFGGRHPFVTAAGDGTPGHRAFVAAWRKAKTIELQGIIDQDAALAELAARNSRRAWDKRVAAGLEAVLIE